MKKRKALIVFGLIAPFIAVFWSFAPLQESNHPILQTIIKKFEAYFKILPQQKVYLQFDKFSYKVDETVWFKAYLVDGMDHAPDSSTSNLYVDLINPSGYIVQSKLIRMTNGFGNGDFSFQDTIPEGFYKIRAFTNWMRNMDEDFYFEKTFYIANPHFSTYVTREELNKIKREKRKNQKRENKFDVQFLPEGGHLLYGVENKLGFKVLNELGHGISVSGEIIDSKSTIIAEFKSSDLGMGSLVFTPLIKEKYTALINTGGEKLLKIKMPEAIDLGVNISASKVSDDMVKIKLISNFPAGQYPPNTSYFLLAHIRGRIVFTHEFDLKNPENSVDVNTEGFPTGIVHFSLFNMYSQPVSERLVFVNNQNELKISIKPSKSVATSGEKMSFSMKITDKSGIPVNGNFSVSIANAGDMATSDNIVSNLLLNSDLKGKVENPKYYFTDWNAEKEKQLDDLMLTQGWRRYSWTNVLSDLRTPPRHENEKGIVISGKITRELFALPLRDIKVTLSILNEFNDVYTTRSGEKGQYSFEDVDYQDTISVTIEAERANGKRNLVIYVDSKEDPRDKEMNYLTKQNLKKRGTKGQYSEPEDPNKDDPFAEENSRIYRLHEEPSAGNVILIDDKNQNYQSVGQIIEGRVPGVSVSGNKVVIRGINTLYGNTDPLFLVDGVPVDADYAMSMNPYDIERIEVLKGPETAIYGSRGGNGVIAIYTRRGRYMKKGILEFKMLGYHTPKEFYNPLFEYRSDDVFEDDRRTILWMPYVVTDSDGAGDGSFHASDVKGKYMIWVEGISIEGTPGSGISEFEVK